MVDDAIVDDIKYALRRAIEGRDAALAEAGRLRAEVATLRAELRRLEWSGPRSLLDRVCPACDRRRHLGHRPEGCTLAAALEHKGP